MHTESDEGINNENPNFTGNEFGPRRQGNTFSGVGDSNLKGSKSGLTGSGAKKGRG